MSDSIPLGPFELAAPIGEGGMGAVWRGVHRAQGLKVAVKILAPQAARRSRAIDAFRAEVRAVATLHHPGVVQVYDHGRVGGETAEAAEGRIEAGSPYLVMELVEGGTLRRQCGDIAWDEARRLLLSLLEALGHAHARGVIHRDIKPENVLLDGSGRAVLTDFGIAEAVHAIQREARRGRDRLAVGTPAYMAPEQFTGRWRDYGPWTDLYAVGCLAQELLSGAPPFGLKNTHGTLAAAHLAQPPPPIRPVTPVPTGLAGWLGILLDKAPSRRFRFAADAARALEGLGPPDPATVAGGVLASARAPEPGPLPAESPPKPPGKRPGDGATPEPTADPDLPTLAVTSPLATTENTRAAEAAAAGSTHQAPAAGSTHEAPSAGPTGEVPPIVTSVRRVPAVPESWRRREDESPRRLLGGAGLALYGLGPTPLVGRDAERDRLWSELRQCSAVGRPRAVILRGPSGVGKTRLARWLSERAHELGAASVMQAIHGPIPGPAHGIGPMLARFARLQGSSRREARERLLRLLEELGSTEEGLADRLAAHVVEEESGEVLSEAQVRHAAVAGLLEALGRERPVVVHLDDVQWGVDALGLALHLLARRETLEVPALLVLTVRDESLTERPVVADVVEEIVSTDGATVLDVGALSPEGSSELVRQLVGLSGELAAQLDRRAAGNPLFAEQLVGDWVERGVLVAASGGYRLAPDARAELPTSLEEVWRARIERVLEDRAPADGEALELAAVLGQRVETDEWEAACQAEGLTVPSDLVEALMTARLVRVVSVGVESAWSFVHGMLREALETRAAGGGRLARHHRTCARLLSERVGQAADERLGRHLLAAGDLDAAVAPLTRAALRHLHVGDARSAGALLADREAALDGLDVISTDPRRIEGWLLLARRARVAGRCDDVAHWAGKAARAAETAQRPRDLAGALVELGRATREGGSPGDAQAHLDRAGQVASEAGDMQALAWSHRELGWVCLHRGEIDAARQWFESSLSRTDETESSIEVAECWYGLGWAAIQRDHLDEARERFEKSRKIYVRQGSAIGQARCVAALGDLERMCGDLEAAERWCREALLAYRRLGHVSSVVPLTNLGLVLVERGLFEAARRTFREARVAVQHDRRELLALVVDAGLLAAEAGMGILDGSADLLDRIESLHHRGVLRHVDAARPLTQAARLLNTAGAVEAGRRTAQVAREQWASLGRDDEARALADLLA